jgi:hypothetical protein
VQTLPQHASATDVQEIVSNELNCTSNLVLFLENTYYEDFCRNVQCHIDYFTVEAKLNCSVTTVTVGRLALGDEKFAFLKHAHIVHALCFQKFQQSSSIREKKLPVNKAISLFTIKFFVRRQVHI